MREVLEAYVEAYLRYLAASFADKFTGGFKTSVYQPFLRRQLTYFLKSRLKVARLRPV